MRRVMLMFAALALLAGACGDDDDAATTSSGDATTTTAEDTTTSTTSTTSTTTSTTTASEDDDDPDGVQLEQSCQSPDGFTISYPSDWEAVGDCGQFGPAPLDEPEPNTDERTGVVSAYIDPVPFEQVSESTEGDTAREETIDGLPAVRAEGEQSGVGLYPEGTPYVRWMVDLSDVRGNATLFANAYDLRDDVEFDQAVEVLDAMVQTLEITDG